LDNLPVPATYLPATDKDLYTYRNKETGKVEQIDLRTGKQFEAYLPTKLNEFCNQTADFICNDITEGLSLKATLATYNIPTTIFYKWLTIFPEFNKRYMEARKQRSDYHFHRAVELADGAIGTAKDFIPGLKLAVDTHKWAAEKSDPERFAKPKEESNNVGSVTINLHTGVLDRQPPKDIVVDQFGNFQGFGDVVIEEELAQSEEVQLDQNRWEISDARQEEDSTGDKGEEKAGVGRRETED
jgi:hypothetical protein